MGNWCSSARLVVVEGGLQVEDGPPVLNGHDPPGREGPAVADAVDLVEDGHGRVARSQEVRVQRVHPPVLDRAPRRHQRLPGHLTAEDPLALLVGLGAPEDVDLNGLEVEQIDEEVQGCAHRAHVRRPPEHRATGHAAATAATLRRRDPGSPTAARELVFPAGFVWGVATAAHQIEGGNVNNDWWAWEHEPASGTARAQRRRLRLVPPLARGRRAGGRHGARRLPLLARVEPHRARGG